MFRIFRQRGNRNNKKSQAQRNKLGSASYENRSCIYEKNILQLRDTKACCEIKIAITQNKDFKSQCLTKL